MSSDEKIIQLHEVSKFYGTLKALDNLTFSIRPGAIGLLGPNGAGKSTLIKALLGLVHLTHGTASVLGLDVRRESKRIREQVGYMPEDDCSFAGLKGIESVAYAGKLAGLPGRTSLLRAHEILDYVGTGEERYREVQTYSKGMRQKIKFAQAIIHAPKIVFLDEPTSGLDPAGREKMLLLIRDLVEKKGLSIVISTHILKDVEYCCDAVVMVQRGRLLAYDTLKNLSRPVDESYLVRFEGDMEGFVQELKNHGCTTKLVAVNELRVLSQGQHVPDLVFRSASQCGVTLRQINPSRNSLEDTFLKEVSGEHHANL